jgi:chemotaxis protein CheZ
MTTEKPPCGIEAGLMATAEGRDFLEDYRARVTGEAVQRVQTLLDVLRMEGGLEPSPAEALDRRRESEMVALARMILAKINETREELQSITSMAKERDIEGFNAVEDELAAIVVDTERATNDIMDAADHIEACLRSAEGQKISDELRREIMRKCTDITMSCSFQDITGQRVRKVVEVIQMIDQQITSIERRLGTPMDSDKVPSEAEISRAGQREAGLLQGPSLPGQNVDQDEIDRLFPDD